MRQIKFKYYMQHEDTGYIISKIFELEELESYEGFQEPHRYFTFKRCQFTGLFDKQGVEIYEGDIVIQYEIPNKPFEIKQLIFFSDGMFCVGKKDEIETPLYLETKTQYRGKDVNLIEIIGNIYEHRHLLDNLLEHNINFN